MDLHVDERLELLGVGLSNPIAVLVGLLILQRSAQVAKQLDIVCKRATADWQRPKRIRIDKLAHPGFSGFESQVLRQLRQLGYAPKLDGSDLGPVENRPHRILDGASGIVDRVVRRERASCGLRLFLLVHLSPF